MADQDWNLLPSRRCRFQPTHIQRCSLGKVYLLNPLCPGLTQKTSFPCICSQLVWKLHYQSLIWLTLSPTPGWHCESQRERRRRAGERRRAGSYSCSGTNNQRQRGPNPLLQLKAAPLLQEGAGSCTEASTKHKETLSGPYLLIWKMSSLEGSPNPSWDCLPDSLDFQGPMAKLGGREDLSGPEA